MCAEIKPPSLLVQQLSSNIRLAKGKQVYDIKDLSNTYRSLTQLCGKKPRYQSLRKTRLLPAFKEQCLSDKQISNQIKRSKIIIDNFVKQGVAYGQKKRRYTCRKVNIRQERDAVRLSRGSVSLRQVDKQDNIPVTSLSQIVNLTTNLQYKKENSSPW